LLAQEVDSDDAEDISSDEEAPELDDEGKNLSYCCFQQVSTVLYGTS
jgi:hypothetical protein